MLALRPTRLLRRVRQRRKILRIRLARGFWTSRSGLALLGVALAAAARRSPIVFAYYYIQFGHLIDERLTGQIYQNTSRVYSAPGAIFVGESLRASRPRELSAARRVSGKRRWPVRPGVFRRQVRRCEIRTVRGFLLSGQQRAARGFSGLARSRTSSQLADGAELRLRGRSSRK